VPIITPSAIYVQEKAETFGKHNPDQTQEASYCPRGVTSTYSRRSCHKHRANNPHLDNVV